MVNEVIVFSKVIWYTEDSLHVSLLVVQNSDLLNKVLERKTA